MVRASTDDTAVIARRASHRESESTWPGVSEAAFATAIRENDERLRALAFHLLGSRDAMDDVLQEAYLKAHRCLGSFRGDSSLSTWLYRIALTTCLDALRRERRQRALTARELAATVPHEASLDESLALRDRVHRALGSLTPERCVAVLLVLRDGLTYAEAAEVMGVPAGTVASRVALGRKQLIREL